MLKEVEPKQVAFDKWEDWHLKEIKKYTLEQVTSYVFCVDAMNFCFWPNNTEGEFEYENMTRNLEKLMDSEPQFFTTKYLATI